MKVIVPLGIALCVASFFVPVLGMFVALGGAGLLLVALVALCRGYIAWAGIWSRGGAAFAGVIAALMFLCGTVGAATHTPDFPTPPAAVPADPAAPAAPAAPAPEEVPREYRSALTQAGNYAKRLHLSKAGIFDQLTSEYGGQFTVEAAQYAIDNVQADWNANALAQARNYQDRLSMSPAAIHGKREPREPRP